MNKHIKGCKHKMPSPVLLEDYKAKRKGLQSVSCVLNTSNSGGYR